MKNFIESYDLDEVNNHSNFKELLNSDLFKKGRKDTGYRLSQQVIIGGYEVKKSIRPINQPLDTKEQLAHAFKYYVIDDQMEKKLAEFLKNNKD